jgi:hypothetical protein
MSCQNQKIEYEVLGYLGHGGFGQISKVRRLSDGKVRNHYSRRESSLTFLSYPQILAMKKINHLSKLDRKIRQYMDNEV